jgi:hypothetical protein
MLTASWRAGHALTWSRQPGWDPEAMPLRRRQLAVRRQRPLYSLSVTWSPKSASAGSLPGMAWMMVRWVMNWSGAALVPVPLAGRRVDDVTGTHLDDAGDHPA